MENCKEMSNNKDISPGSVPVTHAKAHEFRITILVLRMLLLLLAVISLVLIVTDRQTGSVPLPFLGLPKPIYLTRTAEYKLVKGIRFLVDAMGVVIGYTFLQLLFNIGLIATKGSIVGSKTIAWASFVADSAMAYLIVSAAAVGTQLGYLAERGAPDVMWNKVCSYFGHFCTVYAIAVVMSFLAAFAAFVVTGVSAYHLFRLYGIQQQQQSISGKQPI